MATKKNVGRNDPDQPGSSGPELPVDERVVGDVITAVDAQLPAIMNYLTDLVGRAAPRISAREKKRFSSGLRRKMQRLMPAFAQLESTRDAPDSADKLDKVRAALRAVLIEIAAPPRMRKSPDADRLDWFVAMAAKARTYRVARGLGRCLTSPRAPASGNSS
jgi:hypothetical protein